VTLVDLSNPALCGALRQRERRSASNVRSYMHRRWSAGIASGTRELQRKRKIWDWWLLGQQRNARNAFTEEILRWSDTSGWTKLNGANAVSFVAVKHVLENFDNFWQVK